MAWIVLQDQPKLLPCPFCGGEAKAARQGGQEYMVECRGACQVHPDVYSQRSLSEVVDDWNRRAHSANPVGSDKP